MLEKITDQLVQNASELRFSNLAIISPLATIGKNVQIGPYSIIGDDVYIGDNTQIGAHVYIKGNTVVGQSNKIFHGAIIGEDPQDLKYQGEYSQLIIGDNNIIREYATVHRGTKLGGGVTQIRNNNLIMSHAHIAHDVQIGNHNIIAQNAIIGGHVSIHDYAIVGGVSGVHQFVQVGSYSMIGACSMIRKDVLPFSLVVGNSAKCYGLNVEGLRRRKFSEEEKMLLKKVFTILNQSSKTKNDMIAYLSSHQELVHPHVDTIIDFLKSSTRGVYKIIANYNMD